MELDTTKKAPASSPAKKSQASKEAPAPAAEAPAQNGKSKGTKRARSPSLPTPPSLPESHALVLKEVERAADAARNATTPAPKTLTTKPSSLLPTADHYPAVKEPVEESYGQNRDKILRRPRGYCKACKKRIIYLCMGCNVFVCPNEVQTDGTLKKSCWTVWHQSCVAKLAPP